MKHIWGWNRPRSKIGSTNPSSFIKIGKSQLGDSYLPCKWLYLISTSLALETIESAVTESYFIFVRDTRDMKIMSVPLISGQIRCSAHLSLFEVDLCALIKRRFVPHGSCVNAIFPRQLFEHTLALVTYIYVNLTKNAQRLQQNVVHVAS